MRSGRRWLYALASKSDIPDGTVTSGRPRVFYGWWIALSGAATASYGGGTFWYGFTTFFNPIIQEFGWSRAVTSLAFTLQRGESGFAAPIVGYLVDRIGPRVVMFIGAIVGGWGFILISYVNSLWFFYVSFFVLALGWSFSSPLVGYITLAHWFRRRRARAMALLSVGISMGGIMVPVLVWGVDTFGWREALRGVGIGMWIVCIPLALVYRHSPEPYGYLPDGVAPHNGMEEVSGLQSTHSKSEDVIFTTLEALKTWAFWIIGIIFILWMFVHSSVMIHVMPVLDEAGISRTTSGFIVCGMLLVGIAGRLGLGTLADYWDKKYVIALSLLLMTVGLIMFSTIHSMWQATLFLVAYGTGFAAFPPVRSALQADYFGHQNFGTVQGALQLVGMLGGMVGPVFAGGMFDLTGSYRLSILVFALAAAIAVPVALTLHRPPLPNWPERHGGTVPSEVPK